MRLSSFLLIAVVLTLTGPSTAASAIEAVGDDASACLESMLAKQAAEQLRRLVGAEVKVCSLGSIPANPCNRSTVGATDIDPPGKVVDGRLMVMTNLHCEDGRQRRLPLWFSVEAQQRTAVASRALRSGALVAPGDLEWTDRLLPVSTGSLIANERDAVGRRLARPLRAGDELRASDLRAVSAVESGKTVEAVLTQGRVRLKFDAIAMGDGDSGERIRVKSRHGGRSLPARVTGNHTVELLP